VIDVRPWEHLGPLTANLKNRGNPLLGSTPFLETLKSFAQCDVHSLGQGLARFLGDLAGQVVCFGVFDVEHCSTLVDLILPFYHYGFNWLK